MTVLRAAALLPVLLAAVLPTHVLTLVCRFGAVMDVESCCPAEHDAVSINEARVRDEPCCTLRMVDLEHSVSEQQSYIAPASHHEIGIAVIVPAFARRPTDSFVRIRSTAPPHLGPPLILLKQSFLI